MRAARQLQADNEHMRLLGDYPLDLDAFPADEDGCVICDDAGFWRDQYVLQMGEAIRRAIDSFPSGATPADQVPEAFRKPEARPAAR